MGNEESAMSRLCDPGLAANRGLRGPWCPKNRYSCHERVAAGLGWLNAVERRVGSRQGEVGAGEERAHDIAEEVPEFVEWE